MDSRCVTDDSKVESRMYDLLPRNDYGVKPVEDPRDAISE
jgi:hypothetical protein